VLQGRAVLQTLLATAAVLGTAVLMGFRPGADGARGAGLADALGAVSRGSVVYVRHWP
jgi:hypothetical protein